MATNLTTLIYPVSTSITNVPNVSARIANSIDISLANNSLSASSLPVDNGLGQKIGLTNLRSGNGTILKISGTSYYNFNSYLQVRRNNANYQDAELVYSKLICPFENFDIDLPAGIQGAPVHVLFSTTPLLAILSVPVYFFTVNYKL